MSNMTEINYDDLYKKLKKNDRDILNRFNDRSISNED